MSFNLSERLKSIGDNKTNECEPELIGVMLKAMETHINDEGVCDIGCRLLWRMSFANCYIQEKTCEEGIRILLDVLKVHENNKNLVESCCSPIAVVLSSRETHSKYCTPDVLDAVQKCVTKYSDSAQIAQFFLGLERKEDPMVGESVSTNVCTKKSFVKCSNDCGSDENVYCPDCCVQQKAFRCYTCDKEEIKVYCETCWRNNHQGHKCEEFFYSVRCGTK